MRLPPRPTTTDSTTARLVDAVLLELFEIQQVHALGEAAHHTNRQAAQRAYDEALHLMATAPADLTEWTAQAHTVAEKLITETMEKPA